MLLSVSALRVPEELIQALPVSQVLVSVLLVPDVPIMALSVLSEYLCLLVMALAVLQYLYQHYQYLSTRVNITTVYECAIDCVA